MKETVVFNGILARASESSAKYEQQRARSMAIRPFRQHSLSTASWILQRVDCQTATMTCLHMADGLA